MPPPSRGGASVSGLFKSRPLFPPQRRLAGPDHGRQVAALSQAEIPGERPRLTPEARAEIRAKLDELDGDRWLDADELTGEDRRQTSSAVALRRPALGPKD